MSRGRGGDRIDRKIEPASVAGRVPPHDLDAEAAVLSAVLLSREAIDLVLDILKPEHFYSDANGRIFDAVVQLVTASEPVDIVSVGAYLRDRERLQQIGGPTYLAQLADATPAVHHAGAHAKIVYEKWRIRALIATCQRVSAEGYGDVGDPQTFIDGAEQAVYALGHQSHRREMHSIGQALREEFQALTEAVQRGETMVGCPSGFDKLDERLAGLAPGDFTIIAGRPGMGKTAAACAIGVNIAAPRAAMAPRSDGTGLAEVQDVSVYGVCVFSLEMPERQLMSRVLCSEGRVDFNRYRTRKLQDQDWKSLTDAATWLSHLPIWVDDTPAVSLLEIRAKVRRKQAEFDREAKPGQPARKVAVVIIDYLQLMKGREGASSREQEISEISRGLKELAKELNVHVIALSQLNRAAETRSTKDKRPQLSDLRESGSLEQDADNVIFVYRHEYYFPDEQKYRGLAEWIAAKVRNGQPGKVFVRFEGRCTRFDNLAPGDYPDLDAED